MVSIQSESTPPVVRAFERRATDTELVTPGETLATGLNVPGGVGHFRVLEILYQSEGAALAVPESALIPTMQTVLQDKGWALSPEGAACLAALDRLVDRGLIRPGDQVVAFNTCAADKYGIIPFL